MDEIVKARWKFLGIIFIVIIVVHVIIISLIVSGNRRSTPAAPPIPVEQTAAAQPTEATPAPAPAAEKKPGFWSRLFGGGKKDDAQPAAAKVEEQPKPVVYRYKKPTGNPLFGKPFEYSHARHGNLPSKEVPGSDGAATGIMVDLTTRNVLWEKNSTKAVPIASMVKMMTLLVTFEAMEANPAISLESKVDISREVLKVPRTGVVWLDPRETFPLSDLLKAVTIKSANDAAVQTALFICNNDLEKFITRMNVRAVELGMLNSNFVSPCGLPDKKKGDSLSSARDMVVLGEQLLEYPKILEWSTTQLDYIREGQKKTMLTTTNKLINPHWPGVDGLKTGYTDAAGSCLTFSVLRNGRRIVGSVTGFKSARDRDRFCRKLIDWGYAEAERIAKK